MGNTITPSFNISRKQIADFAKDPRTIRDVEALARMLREQVPTALAGKVDDTRLIIAGAGLTGGGDLSADITFDVGQGTGMIINADDIAIDLVAEAERIRDVIGAALTDTATIDFTANDAGDTITADLKNTTVTAAAYGDATHVGTFTADAQGRLTAAASVAIAFPSVSSGGGLLAANNLSDVASVSTARMNLGATTVGANLFTLTNPGAIAFPRYNADNSVSALSASAFRAAIGAGVGDLVSTNNLSDLASAATARTNLGLLRTIAFFFTTTPTTSEVLALFVAADAFTIPANMSGTQVKVGTNATATFAIDVQQNGTTVGTISIATSGTATLTTTSGTSKAISAGDVIKFVAPSSVDATIANVAINVKGTL